MSSPICTTSFDRSASASASADSARSTSPATTPATVDADEVEDGNKAHAHEHDGQAAHLEKSESSSWSDLPHSVLDVLRTYDALARGLPLPRPPQYSVEGSELESRNLLWPGFSPNEYAVLQSIFTASCPPLEWTAAVNFHRTKAREEYYANTLRLRMPSPIHDVPATEIVNHLIRQLDATLAAHPVEKGLWKVERHACADFVLGRRNEKRCPDNAISVKRRRGSDVQMQQHAADARVSGDGEEPDNSHEPGENQDQYEDEKEDEEEQSTTGTTPAASPPAAEDIFPAVVIEVGFSNKAEQDLASLEYYIDSSDGHIRTVLYLDIEYQDITKRRKRYRQARKRKKLPSVPRTTLSVLQLAPDPQNPASEDEIRLFKDVLIPVSESQQNAILLTISNFLPTASEPDSIVPLPYASLRETLNEAWKQQMWRDEKVSPADRGRKINTTKRKREEREAEVKRATNGPYAGVAHHVASHNEGSSSSGMQTRSSGKRPRIDIAR